MEFKISLLSQLSPLILDKYLATLANWYQQQWSNQSIETRVQQFEQYRYKKELPSMYLAHETELMGSIAININQPNKNNESFKSSSVWVSNLYIDNKYRHKGVGRSLLSTVIGAMKKTSYKTLYLTTNDQQQFYEKLGWHEMVLKEGLGEGLTLFRYQLTEATEA